MPKILAPLLVGLVSVQNLCCYTFMNNDLRNWTNIRIFLAVIRAGSTLAASKQLGMAQPTVARRIDALEHETGLTLFERDTRGFKPTPEASSLLPLAEALEKAASDLSAAIDDMIQPRPIRITGFTANFAGRARDIFSAFSAAYPQVPLEFLPGARTLDLMAGEADIAMRFVWKEQHPDLICRHISVARTTLYGSAEYAARHGLPSRPQDMIQHRIFSYRRPDIMPILHDWILQYVPEDRITRVYSEVSLMDAAVRAGQGLALLNLRLVESDEKAGKLIRCFEPPEALAVPHMVVISPDAYRRPEVRAFARFFIPRYAAIFKS